MLKTGASSSAPPSGKGQAKRGRVLVPLALDFPYDYRVPEGMAVAAGDFVRVPLGRRERVGCVWDGEADAAAVAPERLKDIRAKLPARPLAEKLRRFVEWVARYNCAALGAVLKMVMSAPDALEAEKPATGYARAEGAAPTGVKMTEARGRVLDGLA